MPAKSIAPYVLSLALVTGLWGCGSSSEPEQQTSPPADTSTTSPPVTETESEPEAPRDTLLSQFDFEGMFTYQGNTMFDFGWRYYFELPENRTTPYSEDFRLTKGKFKVLTLAGDTIAPPLEGYPHSYRRLTPQRSMFIMYRSREIYQSFEAVMVDENWQEIETFTLAEAGGDEGDWSYRYGIFSPDFGVYDYWEAAGHATDTTLMQPNSFVLLTPDERVVVQATKSFFRWYVANQRKWSQQRGTTVTVRDKYYVVDTTAIPTYAAWLDSTQLFSQHYIAKEQQFFENDCVSQLQEMRAEGLEADGVPPCFNEADVFTMGQESMTREDLVHYDYTVRMISPEQAEVQYMASRVLEWVKEGGQWRLNRDPYYP